MRTYKAEFADDEIEVFSYCSNDDEALKEAFSMESEHGTLFNLFEVDEDYNILREALSWIKWTLYDYSANGFLVDKQ